MYTLTHTEAVGQSGRSPKPDLVDKIEFELYGYSLL